MEAAADSRDMYFPRSSECARGVVSGCVPERCDEAWTWIITKGFKGNLRFHLFHKACVLNPPISVIDNLIAAKSIHCIAFYAGKGVVDTLLIAHPKAAESKDNKELMPLHYACLKGADVASLLSTYPKAARSKDDQENASPPSTDATSPSSKASYSLIPLSVMISNEPTESERTNSTIITETKVQMIISFGYRFQ